MDEPTAEPPIGLPRWGKVAIVVAGVLLALALVSTVDWSSHHAPSTPNLIGFDSTTTR